MPVAPKGARHMERMQMDAVRHQPKAGQGAKLQRIAVSPTEAALMLGISRAKLYELIGSGQIKSVKLGSRRLIPVSAIESIFTEAA
jgi:excisionase family DNA binding protein